MKWDMYAKGASRCFLLQTQNVVFILLNQIKVNDMKSILYAANKYSYGFQQDQRIVTR